MANQPPQPRQPQALPQHAIERIQAMRGAQGQRFFTSDLSVKEYLLIRESGFEAAGLVMGSSIYHVGYQRGKWAQSMEMTVLTQALYEARELAMARMEEEAEALGAHGIVGVRLTVNEHSWADQLLEFVAVGTAIYPRDATKNWRAPNGRAFTSDLSGQDFWLLLKSQTLGGWFKTAGQNVEMTTFTQALYDARELAMERLQYEAQTDGASGVVGAEISEWTHGSWDPHVIEFFAVGTSVLPIETSEPPPTPQLVMSVDS
jgi:uncharacterized protein YbjQ (UPF0145 family)